MSNIVQVALKIFGREVGGTDLLSDTTCLTSLDFCLSELVKDKRFSRIDVTHDTHDWTAEFACFSTLLIALLPTSSLDWLRPVTC